MSSRRKKGTSPDHQGSYRQTGARRSTANHSLSRKARFEVMEPRVVLSTNPMLPIDSVAATAVDSASAPVLSTEPVVQPLSQFAPAVTYNSYWSYSDPHAQTGLNDVREDYGLTGAGQTVVVIDSGIAWDHEAFVDSATGESRIVAQYDFVENDTDAYDDGPYGSHGTHVTGILAGSDDGFQGVATGVDIVSLRVFGDYGQSDIDYVEDALQWVIAHQDDFTDSPITTVNLSLGMSWSGTNSPYGGQIEDELATLEEAGIFIAVAAGNSFAQVNDTSLSYPASSEYVTPVASVDSSGSLSYFSQRNDDVIAAPGRSILSTVPDYLGNRNGVADDYARFSGTSMATPYVAGASVLLRQAYEIVGTTGIDQDLLYQTMYDTADLVYDSITGQNYRSLNIAKAVGSILSTDDFGSTASDAYDYGALSGAVEIEGAITSLEDLDFFTFTATNNGTLRLAANVADSLTFVWDTSQLAGATINNAGQLVMQVTAGMSYTLGASIDGAIGRYMISGELETPAPTVPTVPEQPTTPTTPSTPSTPSIPTTPTTPSVPETPVTPETPATPEAPQIPQAVAVTQNTFSNVVADAQGQWLAVTATYDGVMTIDLPQNSSGVIIDAWLSDDVSQPPSESSASGRLELTATAGQTFYIKASTANGLAKTVDVRATNLVSLDDAGNLLIHGTDGDDTLDISMGDRQAGTPFVVQIDGLRYEFTASRVASVLLDARLGNDSLHLTGTQKADTVEQRAGQTVMTGSGYRFEATGAENVTIDAGAGNDTVFVYDSIGNDTVSAGPDFAMITYADGSTAQADDFAAIWIIGNSGGYDRATLTDSTGNDTVIAASSETRLVGSGYYTRVQNFDAVTVNSVHGGNDQARLYDSAGNDHLTSTPEQTTLTGSGYAVTLNGFTRVSAYARYGGTDTAKLSGSSGNDSLVISTDMARVAGTGYSIDARGFESVSIDAGTGGYDRAYLYDSAHSETLTGSGSRLSLVDSIYAYEMEGFDFVWATSRRGGDDRAEIAAIDYVINLSGNWKES